MDEALAASKERPGSRVLAVVRRVVRAIGWTAIVAGVLILGFVVQQLFVTTWLSQQQQEALAEEAEVYFAEAEVVEVEYIPQASTGTVTVGEEDTSTGTISEGATGTTTERGEPLTPKKRTLLVESTPDRGQPFAIIRVPTIERLEEGWTVVEGVELRDLKNGAGHMPNTPLPGQPGNAVISGHRTTYGAPFHDFEELNPGDVIEVDTALGTHRYEVRETIIVRPSEMWVTEPREGSWLTLTTCHPKFSARQRLIVFAELVDGPNWETIYA